MAAKNMDVHAFHAKFHLNKEEDARAWDCLQNLNKAEFKSISQGIVAAVNAYFGQERPAQGQADTPAGDTFDREQLRQIMREEMPAILAAAIQSLLLQGIQPVATLQSAVVPAKVPEEEPEGHISEDTLAFMLDT